MVCLCFKIDLVLPLIKQVYLLEVLKYVHVHITLIYGMLSELQAHKKIIITIYIKPTFKIMQSGKIFLIDLAFLIEFIKKLHY